MLKKLLLLHSIPLNWDAGLLALRIIAVTPILLKHGLEKVFTFSQMAGHFPDPLGIGVLPSLVFAMISDAICTVLLILGFATRWAALIVFVNVGVAWAFVHHFTFFGPEGGHGELMVVYLGVMVTLFLGGAGKFSVDGLLSK